MSTVRCIYLRCDVEGCTNATPEPAATEKDARECAKAEGWRYIKGYDVCPECIATSTGGNQ